MYFFSLFSALEVFQLCSTIIAFACNNNNNNMFVLQEAVQCAGRTRRCTALSVYLVLRFRLGSDFFLWTLSTVGLFSVSRQCFRCCIALQQRCLSLLLD